MRSFRLPRDLVLEIRVGVHDVPVQRHEISPLSGHVTRAPGEAHVDEPEKHAERQHEYEDDERGAPGLLARRPHHLAKLHARGLDVGPEIAARSRPIEQHEAGDQAAQHHQHAQDLRLVLEPVVRNHAAEQRSRGQHQLEDVDDGDA